MILSRLWICQRRWLLPGNTILKAKDRASSPSVLIAERPLRPGRIFLSWGSKVVVRAMLLILMNHHWANKNWMFASFSVSKKLVFIGCWYHVEISHVKSWVNTKHTSMCWIITCTEHTQCHRTAILTQHRHHRIIKSNIPDKIGFTWIVLFQ